MAFISGAYLTVPTFDLNAGESTSVGTGTMISTLFEIDFYLNCVFALTRYSIFDREKFSTVHSTQIRGLMCVSSL
jgi:hypothetical protein